MSKKYNFASIENNPRVVQTIPEIIRIFISQLNMDLPEGLATSILSQNSRALIRFLQPVSSGVQTQNLEPVREFLRSIKVPRESA